MTRLFEGCAGTQGQSMGCHVMEFMIEHHGQPGQPATQDATESLRKKNAMEEALLEAVQLDTPDATAKDVKMPEVLESWLYMARSGRGPAEQRALPGVLEEVGT